MKTFLPFKPSSLRVVLLAFITSLSMVSNAQTDLVFQNNSLESGTALANNAVYLFPNVNSTMDARIKITGRSSSQVEITNIDINSAGHNKAFQPQIQYSNGNVNGSANWWAEFEIKFYNKGTMTPATITQAYATAIDIDGNNSTLREWDAFYGSSSYTVENNTQLSISSIFGILADLLLGGHKFLGTQTDHSGIDTSATQLMTTHYYQNKNTITIRFGAQTTGAASNTNRMYSVWFKNFTYIAPTTLPIKLASFTATLNNNNKADLKWTTASEINVSHFVIEKSLDGTNFSDAGLMFAYGNQTDMTNYSFSDNLANTTATVIYYRLKSVDVDGKVQYSEIRLIRIGKGKENNITILAFPNPVQNEIRITIPAAWQNKPVTYEIISANGQAVRKTQTASSSQTETINVSTMAPGFYIIKAACGAESAQQRIVKQ